MHKKEACDFKGRLFPSQKAMCEAYGVSETLYAKRRERGWNKEEALTGKKKPPVYIDKRSGRKFYTDIEVAEYYKINLSTFKSKKKLGYSYTDIVRGRAYRTTDHKGKAFRSQKEMCRHYGILPGTFRNRLKWGWSLEDALTTPVRITSRVYKKKENKGND